MSGFSNWLKMKQQNGTQQGTTSGFANWQNNYLPNKAAIDTQRQQLEQKFANPQNFQVQIAQKSNRPDYNALVAGLHPTAQMIDAAVQKEAQSQNQSNDKITATQDVSTPVKLPDFLTTVKTYLFGTPQQKQQLQALQSAKEQQNYNQQMNNPTAGQAFATNFANSASLGLLQNAPNAKQVLNADVRTHPVASTIGNLAGYAIPGAAADKGVSLVARPFLEKLGTSVAGKIAGNVLTGAASNALVAGASDKFQGASNQQAAKDAAIQGLVGGALGGIGGAVANRAAISQGIKEAAMTDAEKAAQASENKAVANAERLLPSKETGTVSERPTLDIQGNTVTAPSIAGQAQAARAAIPASEDTGFVKSVGAKAADFPYQAKTSEFYTNTVKNSDMFNQAEKDAIISQAPESQIITEKQSLKEAKQALQVDFEGEVKDLSKDRQYNGVDTDKAFGILEAYIKEGRATNDYSKAIGWANQTAQKIHDSAQSLQASAKYSRTPEGVLIQGVKDVNNEAKNMLEGKVAKTPLGNKIDKQVNLIDSILKRPNAEKNIKNVLGGDKDTTSKVMKLYQSGKYTTDDIADIIKQKYGVPVLTNDDMAKITDAMQNWVAESDPKLKDNYVLQAAQVIANKLPATFWEKPDSWRYMSMLMNLKTHERNILGNAAMDLMRRQKNLIGTGLEKAIPVEQRTKAIFVPKVNKAFAKTDYTNVEGILKQESKLDFQNVISRNRAIFKTKWLEAWRKFGMNTLDQEDILFLKNSYTDSLAQVVTARKLSPEFLMSKEGAKALDSCRQYAIQEAMRSTFHENSKLAGILNQLQNKSKVSQVLVGGLMPFKKTPINILKQGARYSPAGLVKGLTYDMVQLRKGNITASQFVDNLSMGLTGTAIATLGGWLMSKGLITISTNETGKKQGFETQTGYQNYAVKIGDKTYTIDWITPSCMPFFMGAEIYDSFANKSGNGNAGQKALTAFETFANDMSKVSDPLMNLSMLQGLNSTIKSAAYGGAGSAIGSALENTLGSYAGQFVPTALGQIARTVTPYTKSTAGQDWLQKQGAKIQAKIPGANLLLPNSIDQWGQPISQGNIAERALQNIISPGYLSTAKTNAVNTEVQRLYNATGDTTALPPEAPSYIDYKGKRYTFTPQEKEQFATVMGRAAANGVSSVISSGNYQGAQDYVKGKTKDKLGMISEVYKNAKQQATADFLRKRGIS